MKPVSELLAIKIENAQLKLNALQQQGELIQADLRALLEQARIEVGGPEHARYDIGTRTFQAVKPPVPFQTPKAKQRKRAAG